MYVSCLVVTVTRSETVNEQQCSTVDNNQCTKEIQNVVTYTEEPVWGFVVDMPIYRNKAGQVNISVFDSDIDTTVQNVPELLSQIAVQIHSTRQVGAAVSPAAAPPVAADYHETPTNCKGENEVLVTCNSGPRVKEACSTTYESVCTTKSVTENEQACNTVNEPELLESGMDENRCIKLDKCTETQIAVQNHSAMVGPAHQVVATVSPAVVPTVAAGYHAAAALSAAAGYAAGAALPVAAGLYNGATAYDYNNDLAGQVYPLAEPYVDVQVAAEEESPAAEPYIHEEIAAEPYVHVEVPAEPYIHVEPVAAAPVIAAAPAVAAAPVAAYAAAPAAYINGAYAAAPAAAYAAAPAAAYAAAPAAYVNGAYAPAAYINGAYAAAPAGYYGYNGLVAATA